MTRETIAAIATPRGIGGVGIVRVSGPLVTPIARTILGRIPPARVATHGPFRSAEGFAIDEGIALLFPAPRSYTGEDVLELQGHGGPVVMDLLLGRCLSLGARVARPGEFTERAFLNGKLDLIQAEAVADLIESSTALAARMAARSLQGVFSQRIQALVETLVRLRTYLEATLDFPEEDLDAPTGALVAGNLDDLIGETRRVRAQAHQGERLRDGFTIAIAGPPNAGKSTLLNALSQSDAAIVTPIPGTTRDLLHVDIQVEGLPVHLVDTAGLRESPDPIEKEGVRRAREQIARSDLILWVYDATLGLEPQALATLPAGIPVTLIRNKIDLIGGSASILGDAQDGIALCAHTGEGLELLHRHIRSRAGLDTLSEGAFIARRRHLESLGLALGHLEAARDALQSGLGLELIALDLSAAQQALGEITGSFTSDDLLGRIFSSFCIGK